MTYKWGYKGMIKFTTSNNIVAVFEIIKQSYEDTL